MPRLAVRAERFVPPRVGGRGILLGRCLAFTGAHQLSTGSTSGDLPFTQDSPTYCLG
ncbi:hypothetical protein STEG23_009118 [Scotinomys teguina]